ncbi:MAG: glycosyltransferase family 39 protein [bacterium]|nr:glycosyltransferase family 39 protein [bacterium]
MTKRYAYTAFLMLALALFFGLHYGIMGVNQGGTAHGQQGANLAMAEGFVENGLDFWHPHTSALNYRNGDFSLNKTSTSGITAAHFPIHAYFPAVIHSATNWQLSKVIQGYNLLWGFVGLLFIYLLSLRITNHIGKSLFVVAFIGTAPILAFHQSNFLPEVPAITCAIIGLYYMYRWQIEKVERYAWLGMLWFLISSLPSPDFVLFLVAGTVYIYVKTSKKERFNFKPLVFSLLFIGVLLLSEFKFDTLRHDFGSQFPGWLQDWVYDQSIPNSLFGSWKMHYFTVFQTVVLTLILGFGALNFFRTKRWKAVQFNKYEFAVLLLLPIGYALINPYQAYYSDVFFLKFLLVPATVVLIIIVDLVDFTFISNYPKLSTVGFLLMLAILIGEGNWTQNVRKELNRTSPGSNLAFTFRGSDELLLKHGVKASDPLSVVVPNNWGIGFEVLGYLNHKGFIRETPNGEELVPKIPKGQYLVCHIDEKPALFRHFRTDLQEIGDNGSIVLFKVID